MLELLALVALGLPILLVVLIVTAVRQSGAISRLTADVQRLEQRITIERGGHVTARSGKVEYGQGIRTGFARIVAEELSVPIEMVDVVLGETDSVPWDMGTTGSMSTATDGRQLRAAAIQARTLLLDRATIRLGAPASGLALKDGRVIGPDGRSLSFDDLVGDAPLTGDIPEAVEPGNRPLLSTEDWPLRLEARAILTGAAKYPADIRLPSMLFGHVLHPPRPGGDLLELRQEVGDDAGPGAAVLPAAAAALAELVSDVPVAGAVQQPVAVLLRQLVPRLLEVDSERVGDALVDVLAPAAHALERPNQWDGAGVEAERRVGDQQVRVEVVSLAEAIARIIITEFSVPWARVSVAKPGAIEGSREVGVTIERTTADFG